MCAKGLLVSTDSHLWVDRQVSDWQTDQTADWQIDWQQIVWPIMVMLGPSQNQTLVNDEVLQVLRFDNVLETSR